jgi:hypothetical protein
MVCIRPQVITGFSFAKLGGRKVRVWDCSGIMRAGDD